MLEHGGAAHEEQNRQCTFNVILRRVRESVLPWKAITHTRLYWCACVRARFCVGSQARERADASACNLAYPASNAYVP